MKKVRLYFILHLMLAIFSFEGVCSKMAGRYEFLSLGFCVFYGIMILILGAYAIGWQQIIKRMDLTAAYANKAVTLVWGMIWGVLFFEEVITLKKVIGMLIVMAGVILFAISDASENSSKVSAVADNASAIEKSGEEAHDE